MIDGILPIDKPIGWTSHDVVARVRRVAHQRQVGHAGTLDPLASGLLLLILGSATRLSSYLMESTKTYCAEVVLGATTRTDDAEGPLESHSDISGIDLPTIEAVLSHFGGEIDQIPPAYAAVRHRGEKLYVLARKGEKVEPEPRRVRVDRIDLLGWSSPRLRLRITCGSGTYIRALARDIGAALGVGGYLHALRRVSSGSFTIDDAVPLANLDDESLVTHLQPPERAILTLPAAVLDPEDERRLIHGGVVPLPAMADMVGAGCSRARMPSPPTPSPVRGRGGDDVAEPAVATPSSIEPGVGTVAPSLSALEAFPEVCAVFQGGADVCNTPLQILSEGETVSLRELSGLVASSLGGAGGHGERPKVGCHRPLPIGHARTRDTMAPINVRVYSQSGNFIALATLSDNLLHPRRVFVRA